MAFQYGLLLITVKIGLYSWNCGNMDSHSLLSLTPTHFVPPLLKVHVLQVVSHLQQFDTFFLKCHDFWPYRNLLHSQPSRNWKYIICSSSLSAGFFCSLPKVTRLVLIVCSLCLATKKSWLSSSEVRKHIDQSTHLTRNTTWPQSASSYDKKEDKGIKITLRQEMFRFSCSGGSSFFPWLCNTYFLQTKLENTEKKNSLNL